MERHLLEKIEPRLIGARLAEARRARGMTQQRVADALGLARTTIVAMEKGQRRPRATELLALARLYGRSITEFVQTDSFEPGLDFVAHPRDDAGRARILDPTDARQFETLCRWYVDLEEMLAAPLPRRYPEPYDVSGAPGERAAIEVASAERNRLGLGDGPIGDLWGLLESDVGLRVFTFPMADSRLAGIYVFAERFGGCIAINANHAEGRRRLSAAHELGHFLTDRFRPDLLALTATRRLPEHERFADAFARCFLMPGPGLQRRFELIRRSKHKPVTSADVVALSHLYRVSFKDMMWRLEQLKLLPAGAWDTIQASGAEPHGSGDRLGVSGPEPGSPHLPVRYEALAVQAYLGGELSEGQLAERLRTDRIGARERVAALTMHPETSDEGDLRAVPLDLSAALVAS